MSQKEHEAEEYMKSASSAWVRVSFEQPEEAAVFFKVLADFADAHGIPPSPHRIVVYHQSPIQVEAPRYENNYLMINSFSGLKLGHLYGQSRMTLLQPDFPALEFRKLGNDFLKCFCSAFGSRVQAELR